MVKGAVERNKKRRVRGVIEHHYPGFFRTKFLVKN